MPPVVGVTWEAFMAIERFVRSHAPAGRSSGRRVIPAFQAGADGCLEVGARSGRHSADAVERAAKRAGHVDPGPFGLRRRAAYPPAEPGGLAQFAEQPLPLGLGP